MRTVIETPTFQQAGRKALDRGRAVGLHRLDGSQPVGWCVIPGAEGARKLRWSRSGSGKSSGARVIYFNLTEQEVVLLVAAYAKADRANMLPADIKKVV